MLKEYIPRSSSYTKAVRKTLNIKENNPSVIKNIIIVTSLQISINILKSNIISFKDYAKTDFFLCHFISKANFREIET